MQIAASIRNEPLEKARMKFGRKRQAEWQDTLSDEDRLQYDKAICLAGVGYARTAEQLLLDGVNLDD